MSWNLATDNDIRNLPVHEQLFSIAFSYLEAAQVLCAKAIEVAGAGDWSRGSVVLMNAAHATELFLKATLIRQDPTADVMKYGHDIAALADAYEKLFPEPEYAWEILFRRPKPEGLSSEEMKVYREGVAAPSIEFRYPISKLGLPWITHQGFEPNSFAKDLRRIAEDFDRIYSLGS